MSRILLGRLRQAKYKGLSILVENSNVAFGQKTVKFEYPNSNKTGVEYLGLAEDEFQVDLYLHGSGLIEKIKRLKEKLSEAKDGVFTHPYLGEVTVAVTGRPSLVLNDKDFGLAKFTVTFQQVTQQSYPSEAKNSKAGIFSKINNVLDKVSGTFDDLTTNFGFNAILNATKLNEVMDTFDNALNLTYKVADKATEAREQVQDFKNKIITYAQTPAIMGSVFKDLYVSFFGIATDTKTQLNMLALFYATGSKDRVVEDITLERGERIKNFDTINNCQIANSLALSYGTLADIDFKTNVELEQTRQSVEDQYNKVIEGLDNDVVDAMNDLRQSVLDYLDGLAVSNVVEIETQPTSLLLLGYDYYGTIDRYDELYDLNTPSDPAFIQGTVKVLADGQ